MSDGREQVVLPDRIVIVQSEEHPGSSDSFRSIELRVSVESLGPAITNDRTLFALTTTDGDMFDAISMSPGFEGTISPHETRRGVITFKIPSGVQPQLFYGPARDGEHIGVPLHLGNAS